MINANIKKKIPFKEKMLNYLCSTTERNQFCLIEKDVG